MIYTKTINGQPKFSNCKTIQANDGSWICNPTAEQIAAAGWVEFTPPPVTPAPNLEPDYMQVIEALKTKLAPDIENLTDEEALSIAALYQTWASMLGKNVPRGMRLWYNEKLYKVLQAHTVSSQWTPDHTPALYAEVSIEEWPPIPENIPSTAPWMAGDKGTWQGQHYICKINNTVHNPSQYPAAWELIP
ncbi:MAG: hypothetical protein IKR30_06295 [Bacteroidales bacterium]|nr:hypothetical protein [Bacteroidales bacterium]